jgi:hypothetical protein
MELIILPWFFLISDALAALHIHLGILNFRTGVTALECNLKRDFIPRALVASV